MTDSKRGRQSAEDTAAESEEPVESPEEEQGGQSGMDQPEHEQGYTEETAEQNRNDFGQPVPEVTLEGRGVPGVS